MNKQVILNVDDFGLTEGINQAVFDLNKKGIIKSTTALVNAPYFESDIKQAIETESLAVGIHLTIDLFKAEIYHPSLCDDNLQFYRAKTHDLTRELDSNVVYNEWKAQIEKFIRITGVKPSHIDSHHHAHGINYDAHLAVTKLAAEYQLPVREFTTDDYKSKCSDQFYGSKVSFETLQTEIEELLATDYNYLDIMCHPAFVDDELQAISSYNQTRALEYQVLSSPEFSEYLKENKITISNYTDKR